MSTRRPRIRAVAMLPTRRKAQNKEQDNEIITEKPGPDENISNQQSSVGTVKVSPKKSVISEDATDKDESEDIGNAPKRRRTVKPLVNVTVATRKNKIQEKSPSPKSSDCDSVQQSRNDNLKRNNDITENLNVKEVEKTIVVQENAECSKLVTIPPSASQRRRTVKPPINISTASRNKDKSITSQAISKTSTDTDVEKPIDKDIDENVKTSPIIIRNNEIISSKTFNSIQKSPIIGATNVSSPNSNNSKDITLRRRIVKPTINVMVASRKNKPVDKSPMKITNHKESPSHSSDKCISPSVKKTLDYVLNNVLSPRNKQLSEKTASTNSVVENSLKLNVNVVSEANVNNPVLNDECSFDPIIPLPSANKTNRPKLKPTPRFTLRRNSFQGSASEAEEADVPPSPPPASSHHLPSTPAHSLSASVSTPSSTVRVRHTSTLSNPVQQHKPRTAYRYKVGANIPHQARTMKDLIFYNPPNNAIQPKEEDVKREISQVAPPVVPVETVPESTEAEENEAVPVPQVKLGPNGEIVIDEQSLVIETSEAVRSRQRLQQLSVVWDGGLGGGGGGKYMRGKRCKEWTHRETLRFYRALHTMGTDFSLMLSLFPGRSRRDLKVKFKKEERQNGHLVDKVLMNPLQFDMDELERDAVLDMEAEAKEKEKMKEESAKTGAVVKKKKNSGLSLAARCLGEESLSAHLPTKKPKLQNLTQKKMSTDYIANKSFVLPSPARSLVPTKLEQGSLVLLQEKEGLRAYLAGGETLKPLPLSQDELQKIASKLGQNVTP